MQKKMQAVYTTVVLVVLMSTLFISPAHGAARTAKGISNERFNQFIQNALHDWSDQFQSYLTFDRTRYISIENPLLRFEGIEWNTRFEGHTPLKSIAVTTDISNGLITFTIVTGPVKLGGEYYVTGNSSVLSTLPLKGTGDWSFTAPESTLVITHHFTTDGTGFAVLSRDNILSVYSVHSETSSGFTKIVEGLPKRLGQEVMEELENDFLETNLDQIGQVLGFFATEFLRTKLNDHSLVDIVST